MLAETIGSHERRLERMNEAAHLNPVVSFALYSFYTAAPITPHWGIIDQQIGGFGMFILYAGLLACFVGFASILFLLMFWGYRTPLGFRRPLGAGSNYQQPYYADQSDDDGNDCS
ncbi:MAG: hypothetical protein QM744_02795 [Mesorhizobium sp.]